MKILFNPKNGSTIKDVWFKYSKYFAAGQEFMPGKIIKIDEQLADFILETFGFVQEVSTIEAKELMKKPADTFVCEKCKNEFGTKTVLVSHMKSHETDDELDIPVIRQVTLPGTVEEKKHDPFAAGEAEDKAAGLEGEGLVDEAPRRMAVMR